MLLKNINILLGITGGIAAYKAPELVRQLVKLGANVRAVTTNSANEFVSPLSLQAVSGHPVSNSLLDPAAELAMGHIELAKWADMVLVAPATSNAIAKFANGIADDLLTTLYLATDAPVFVAPAMNQQMWKAPATQRNIATLEKDGVVLIGPAQGEQACGDVGPGRMVNPEDICQFLLQYNTSEPLFAGKHLVITAGPTREPLDPVRYISNHSSGKMGYAIAQAAVAMGAQVTLVSGPVNLEPPEGVKLVSVISADEMLEAVHAHIQDADIFVATAAVADYKAQAVADNKIKKNDQELTLTFVKNPDILKTVAALSNPPFTVGFAAESQNVAEYAKGKLAAKKLNMIAANDITTEGLGFNSDKNALHVFWQNGDIKLPATSKKQLAVDLLQLVAERYNNK